MWMIALKRLSIFFSICLVLAPASRADDLVPTGEPIAVLALVPDQDPDDVIRLAKEIQRKLSSHMNVLPVDQVLSRLGGGPLDGDLERLRGLYNIGYLQSYHFEYDEAINNLTKVLDGLERVPDCPARWDLFIQAKIYIGKSQLGLKNKEKTIQAFQAVLRTRPEMELSPKNHSPRVIKIWGEAKKKLTELVRGRLALTTDPKGASVFLDGVKMGVTPLIGEYPQGQYLLTLHHPDTGGASRQVVIGERPVWKIFKLMFEGSLRFDLGHPAVRLPSAGDALPKHWWNWLGARLDIRRMAVVQEKQVGTSTRWVASLVDLERGRVVREGWLEPSGSAPEHLVVDAVDLANFLIKKEARRVVQKVPTRGQLKAEPTESGEDVEAGKSQLLAAKASPPLDDAETTGRPLGRTWWPYAIGGAVALGGGVAAHVVSEHLIGTTEGIASSKQIADTWLGMAIGGYSLAGALTLTGLVLHLTYKNDSVQSDVTYAPTFGPGELGLGFVGRF